MAAYVTLVNFTDQGARTIKDSPARFEAFKNAAEQLGVNVKTVLWTQGPYDIVLICEGSEEATVALAIKTAALGNVRTQTLRGFSATEFRKMVATALS